MNVYSIVVQGDMNAQTAPAKSAFLQFVSTLFITAVNHTISHTSAGLIQMQFETDFEVVVPADIATVVFYKKVIKDTRSREVLTTLDKPTLWKGDICVVHSLATHDNELEEFITINLPSSNFLYIGQAADSQTDFYIPFVGSVGFRIFDRAKTARLRNEIALAVGDTADVPQA